MIEAKRISTGVAVALLFCLAASPGEAAWWPWSKHTDKSTTEPSPTPPADVSTVQGDDPNAAQPGSRVDQLEAEVRNLTGQVEQLTHDVQTLQGILSQVQGDTEARLEQLEGSAGKPRKQAIAAPAPVPAPASESMVAIAADPAAQAAPDPDAPPPAVRMAVPSVPTLEPPPPAPLASTDAAPLSLAAAPRGTAAPIPAPAAIPPQGDVIASLGDPHADYEAAYNNILTGRYDQAEIQFRAFISAHPTDPHAADAQYWLGESLFARGKYREAAIEFLNGHNAYPNSPKAPDTLLKLGLSLAGLGERDAACQTYVKVLKQYPQASKSLRQRVAVEQASATC